MAPVRAFIVEDSPVILENLVATLGELAGVEVVGSSPSEHDARQWIDDPPEPFNLMIVDIFLKSGSGLGVLRAAKEAGMVTRRVVLTNYATPDIRRRCAELGAERVFDKSSELEDLIDYCGALGDEAGTSASRGVD